MTLASTVGRLERAAEAAREIGMTDQAAEAGAVLGRVRERAGFPGGAFVLALAGGTGVGKSSVLNALAGQTVSAVRAVRPTTDAPIAWVADHRREELAPLMSWLGVRHVAGHADESLADVAILDLPDVDSVRTEHRATVDELLPRIDASAWVVDPEKYDDERLHTYLRTLTHHGDRMRFILNKADRLTDAERNMVVDDLARRLMTVGYTQPTIHVVSATRGDGIAELRAALASEADAKAVVAEKLEADVVTAHRRLAAALAVEPDAEWRPLLADEHRDAAVTDAIDGAVRIVDPAGLSRQVQAAVLGRARRSGGSLLGRAVALLGWATGQTRRRADPAGYLRDWRRRGSLGRVINPIHSALVDAAGAVPSETRPVVMRALGTDDAEAAVARALDEVARDATADLDVPSSVLWPVVGGVQLVIGAVFLLAVAWYVTLFVAGGQVPVATIELEVLGPVPLPLALLGGSVLASAVLGFVLSLHAGWIGRRRGAAVAARVREAVGAAIEAAGTAGLARVEAVRRELAPPHDE